MKESPLVSVVIPSYNMERYVGEAIDSVLGQTYPNVEVIVVDDGSTDTTRDVLEGYADLVRVFSKPNGGESSARNFGIERSEGEYVAFLDADDIWEPKKLERQVEAVNRSRDLRVVTCGHLGVETDGHTVVTRSVPRSFPSRRALLRALSVAQIIPGSSSGVMAHRDCFREVGVFDETIQIGPDWDMWIRLATRFHIHFVEEPLTRLRIVRDKPAFRNTENEERQVARVVEKSVPEPYRPRAIAFNFATLGSRALVEGDVALAESYLKRSVRKWPFRCFPLDFLRQRNYPRISRYYLLAKIALLKLFRG